MGGYVRSQCLKTGPYIYGSEIDHASNILTEALSLSKDLANEYLIGRCNAWLSRISLFRGDWKQAGDLLQEARRLYEKVGDRGAEAGIAADLGRIALKHNRLDETETLLLQGIRWFRDTGVWVDHQRFFDDFAAVAICKNQFDRATRLLSAAEIDNEHYPHRVAGAPIISDHKTLVRACQAFLSEEKFLKLWAEGQGKVLDQVAEYAMGKVWE